VARNETPLTGADAEKATASAQAEFPGGTVLRVETDEDGTYEAHVRKADGTEVEIACTRTSQSPRSTRCTAAVGTTTGPPTPASHPTRPDRVQR